MGIGLNFPERAKPKNYPENADVWDIDLIFRLESNCILEKLKTSSNEKPPEDWSKIETVIRNNYATEEDSNKPGAKNLDKALVGYFKEKAPTESAIRTWSICFWVAIFAEFSVLLLQALFSGDFPPFLPILATTLALGGYFQGRGLGKLFFRGWLHSLDEGTTERHQEWLVIGLGTVLILLVSVMRALGSFEIIQFFVVFFITLFFGEAVAISEAMHVKLKEQRIWCLGKQKEAQIFRANRMHWKKIDEYAKYYQNPNTQRISTQFYSDDIKDQQSDQKQDAK